MTKRLVIDPITRIEGHLRIEAKMQENQIAEAYSRGDMIVDVMPEWKAKFLELYEKIKARLN